MSLKDIQFHAAGDEITQWNGYLRKLVLCSSRLNSRPGPAYGEGAGRGVLHGPGSKPPPPYPLRAVSSNGARGVKTLFRSVFSSNTAILIPSKMVIFHMPRLG